MPSLALVVHSVVILPRHAFALALNAVRSNTKRRFAISLSGALALGILAAQPAAAPSPVHISTTPAAAGGWLDRLNAWRASTGLPALSENATWSQGGYNHGRYMVQTEQVTHSESTAYTQYTPEGDAAARNGNIQVSSTTSSTDEQAIDWWMAAPFHALGMMDPRLTSTGFGSYREVGSGWQEGATLDTLRGNSFSGGTYPVYFPGNGTTEPLTSYTGGESPNPLSACSGYTAPTGLPVFLQVGGNVNTTASPTHSFTGNGVALEHCIIDSTVPAFTSSLKSRGAVIVVPKQPLQNGVRYVVTLNVNSLPYTWSFTVGAFFGITSVTPNTGPTAGGTPVTITGTGFTGATSVKFGTTAATSFTVVNDSTATAVSPAHAAGTVDVNVTRASGTSPISSSDHFTYGPCTAATASGSPASPQASGTQITITGSASGCGSASAQYEFWMLAAGSSTWQLVRGWSATASYTWNSTGALAGTEQFSVWVRDAASLGVSCNTGMGCYDAFVGIPYTVTVAVAGACTSVTASASPVSPSASGTQITITGTSAGCTNPTYQFWMKAAGSTTWQLLRGYSTTAAYAWNSTGALAGTETFGVWARSAGSTASYDTYTSIPFTITTAACTSVTATASPTTALHGTGAQVTITGVAAGCTNARYEFWMKAAGSTTWQLLRGYTTSATYTWNTTGAPAGTEQFGVWVRDATSSASYDTYVSLPFTLS